MTWSVTVESPVVKPDGSRFGFRTDIDDSDMADDAVRDVAARAARRLAGQVSVAYQEVIAPECARPEDDVPCNRHGKGIHTVQWPDGSTSPACTTHAALAISAPEPGKLL